MTGRICGIGLPTDVVATRLPATPALGGLAELVVQMAEGNGYGPMLAIMCEHPERADIILALAAQQVCRQCRSESSCPMATISMFCPHSDKGKGEGS